ncbi:MAG: tyrosine-type recombinase/integrase [Burkholderiaceae bacterium]
MARRRTPSNLHRLSAREVLAAGEGDHTDGGGLLLRVRVGSASWVLRYTAASGKRREMGLGNARRGSVAQAGDALTLARRLAHEARELLQAGRDPIDERDRKRDTAREADAKQKASKARDQQTLARVARAYHEGVIEPSRSVKHAAQWIASLEHHVPPELWHAPIDTITAPALLDALSGVRALADAEVQVPETLKRVRQRLDTVFEHAIFHGWAKTNPAAAVRRKLREGQGRRDRGQHAALPFREAPAFMARLRQQQGIGARCLEFALLTAARTGEAIGARWAEIDLDAAVWTVPAERMKAGEPHVVHLSQRAVEVLEGLQGLDDVFVFPSPLQREGKPSQPLSNMAMLTVLDRMGERERTTVHGLCRATFSTWANETGAERPDVVEACLAHRESDLVKAAYNRARFNAERRALLEAWAAYLVPSVSADVVAMPRAA